ncbi:hypothetical protein Tco_0866625 [Tanacetum coccineum]
MADNRAIDYAPYDIHKLPREFWCTAIAYDPNPPANDSKVCTLKEYKIKFTVMNCKKPLTLEFKTFVESTGLDYNEGTYVSHPTLEVVKAELAKIVKNPILLDRTPILSSPAISSNSKFSKDPSNVTLIELTTSMIVVNNHETSVSPFLFSIKRKKKKFQTVTQTLPKSQRPWGTDGEYLVDKTQSTRPELTSMADFQALLGDDDLKEDSDDDVFEAREEMDEDIQEPKIEET